MKSLLTCFLISLMVVSSFAQVPLGSTYTSKFMMTFSSTGAEVAADSTPKCDTYEETTSTPILVDSSMTLMASTTNVYYVQISATSGNGFELGKWYNVVCKATVGSLLQNIPNDHFRIEPTESSAGYQKVDAALILGAAINTSLAQIGVNLVSGAANSITNTMVSTDTIDARVVAASAIGVSEAPNLDAAISSRLAPTVAARTLDVSAGGEAGIDWANIGSPTTTVNLSGTTLGTVSMVNANTTSVYAGFFSVNTGAGAPVAGSVVKYIVDNAGMTAAVYALTSGTSDSGTTTTMVDAPRTEADTDYWKGDLICFTSGNLANQCREIDAFNAATHTISWKIPTTQAVATQNYSIYAHANSLDVAMANHTTAGTAGASLNAAGAGTDPWSIAIPGAYGAGTAGSKLGRLPDIAVGAAGGLFIAGSNAATTANITGNLTGNVTGSVGSVTGNIGGNLGGNVSGLVHQLDVDAVSAASLSTAAITKIQTNLLTLQKNTAHANFPVWMLDSSGNGVLSLTVTCRYQLDNAAFALTATPLVEAGRGLYLLSLLAGETNGNDFSLECIGAGAQIYRFSANPQH